MSWNAYCQLDIQLRPGTTLEQATQSVQPFLDSENVELTLDASLYETGVSLDTETLDLALHIAGPVSDGFFDNAFKPVIEALGKLVDKPFEVMLVDESSGDTDSTYRLVAGPTNDIAEFDAQCASYSIAKDLIRIVPPPGSTGLTLDSAAGGSSLAIGLAGEKDSPPRLSMNLLGLDLTHSQRKEATALLVLLGRTIAPKNEPLVLDSVAPEPNDDPQPGPRG